MRAGFALILALTSCVSTAPAQVPQPPGSALDITTPNNYAGTESLHLYTPDPRIQRARRDLEDALDRAKARLREFDELEHGSDGPP